MVFLATSPLLSPSIFVITLGGLGWDFALGKLGSAILVGGVIGLGTTLLLRTRWLRDPVQPGVHQHTHASSGST